MTEQFTALLRRPDFAAALPEWRRLFSDKAITGAIEMLVASPGPVTVDRVNTLLIWQSMIVYASVRSDLLDIECAALAVRT